MKNEDEMIDALLQEHARQGSKDDAPFLASLEHRLDEEDGMVAMPHGARRGKSRLGIGVGIAAALTVVAVGFYGWKQDRERDLAMNIDHQVDMASQGGESVPRAGKKKPYKLASRTSPPLADPAPEAVVVAGDKPQVSLKPRTLSPAQQTLDGQSSKNEGIDSAPPVLKSLAPVVANHLERKDSRMAGVGEERKMNKRMDFKAEGRSGKLHVDYESQRIRIPDRRIRPFPDSIGRAVGPSGNRYGSLVDNKFKSPWKAPLSTFSVDVDTASYTNVRRMIQGGQPVPADAVRIEEMINYFNYAYPEPEGRHPFSVHVESASCPWNPEHRLVKVGLQGKEIVREARPAANLVFLLDVSGSMNSQDKLPLLVDSMKILLKELNADDSVSIVVYAGAQGLALPPTYVNEAGRQTILKSLAGMRSGGSTNGGAGITLAYKMAKKHFVQGGVNRVILGSDGDFNVGVTDRKALVSMVESEAKSGVFLSVLGFGQGNLNDAMLEDITNKGNGNYSYIDNLREGRKVFLDDMMGTMVTIAKDVKIQVEFNPAKVKSYRLIGYANRMLKAEDFKNKRIDAGEIGAGHTVTALYEIVPGNAADASVVDGLKYQKNKKQPEPATRELVDSPEMMTVKLAYKQPNATKETESTYFNTAVVDSDTVWKDASDDFKFASGVGLFGMLQRGSSHAGQGDYDLVRKLAEAGRGKDPKGLRTEFSDLVRKVASE
ncbi:MAG: VWA domain-containing protein [Verrucomicrobiae bacterium]|nr:VWA domain-containing protein [Verrucomicrobiae bacterium]NNJ43724.1 VWA domain-containing protein [Akkermansiaceae bacterium]